MRKAAGVLASLSFFGAMGAASAADLAVKAAPMLTPAPVSSWTGFYGGVNLGYGGSSDGITLGASNTGTGGGGTFGPNLRAVTTNAIPGAVDTDPNGVVAGVQLGYNWQFAPVWVFGVEGDIQFSNIDGSGSATAAASSIIPTNMGATATATVSQELNWFATLRARLGYLAMPNMLLYATGGFAFGDGKAKTSIVETCADVCSPVPRSSFGSGSDTLTGWTAGLGIEYAFAPRWTLKAEYLYVDLGDVTYANTPMAWNGVQTIVNPVTTAEFTAHIVRGGLNYRF